MSIKVKLPDGTEKAYPDGSTAHDVALSISKGLAKAVIAAKVNGEVRDLNRPLPSECDLVLLKADTPEGLDVIRHSSAHIMAGAVKRIYGENVKLGFGPPVEDGFYYDMLLPKKVSEDDLPRIQEEVDKILKEDFPFEREDLPKDRAVALMKEMGQDFKLEFLDGLDEDSASIYRDGEFTDLCEGPHVPSTGRVGAIRLMKVTGAYWRGDEKNAMLTRIYGTAWHTPKALKQYLNRLEEAKKRDHRKLGKDLDLFMFHEWSPGSPFLLPKGTIIYNELQKYLREEYARRGFQEVITPQLFNKALWEQSGHWDHFQENMFIMDVDEEQFSLKPMNCPSHCLIYKSKNRSYRDLPIRLADFCFLHRNEVRGALAGMTRVRKMSQDDAHHYCMPDQIQGEIRDQLEFVKEVYDRVFRMEYVAKLSTRPEKAMGEQALWDQAEDALRKALTEADMAFEEKPGEGAFYGPKIDFDVRDALGRPWQLATVQLDFQMPIRFDLKYLASDNTHQRPVMIHRAILGSLERFMAVLVEHFAGEFPLWLAPVQAVVIPINREVEGYARKVREALREAGLRCEIDLSEDHIKSKIKAHEQARVPYMLVVGAREAEAGTVAVREHRKGDRGARPLDELVSNLRRDVVAKIPLQA